MRYFIFALCVMILLGGCYKKEESFVKAREAPAYDLSVVQTIGNHSYVPMEFVMNNSDCPMLVLEVLQKFEEGHLELQITDWKMLNNDLYLFGLWIDHKPKESH